MKTSNYQVEQERYSSLEYLAWQLCSDAHHSQSGPSALCAAPMLLVCIQNPECLECFAGAEVVIYINSQALEIGSGREWVYLACLILVFPRS